jgi:hypothetical protein
VARRLDEVAEREDAHGMQRLRRRPGQRSPPAGEGVDGVARSARPGELATGAVHRLATAAAASPAMSLSATPYGGVFMAAPPPRPGRR